MPDLAQALQGNDLGFLRMVADAWGVELEQPDAATALPVLVASIKDPSIIHEVFDVLPPEALEALQLLMENNGRLGWAAFCRRFGEVRSMGPAKRDRERPDLKPSSITEVLWYRAFVAKAFFNLPPEPQEYAYIPDDLVEYLDSLARTSPIPLGRPASPSETEVVLPASDRILDHACTLLAALRCGFPLERFEQRWPIPLKAILSLLKAANLVDENHQIQSEAVRIFLEASRGESLASLVRAWQTSENFNELHLIPGLCFEGQWDNQPRQSREAILGILSRLPQDSWWSLNSLVSAIKEKKPDFQRPGGDYDSWFIREEGSETYLRGFDSWEKIDGALIRYLVSGPMHWLGLYDLASTGGGAASAFRPSRLAASLWQGQPPAGLAVETAQLRVSPDGRIHAPAAAPRTARYQIARFCEWESETPEEYRFRLTPASLERARQQGLRVTHLLALLKRYAALPLPPAISQALERWERFGPQASLENAILLRLASPDLLAALRKSRAVRFLGEALSPTVVTVKPGGKEAICQALAELGYLADENLS